MGFWETRDAGARPERADDVRGGVIRRPETPRTDAGSTGNTEEHRGGGDHVRSGGTEGSRERHDVKTYQV